MEELGKLERDTSGHIEFEQFIKMIKISAAAAKDEFADQKKSYIKERRASINDANKYKKIVIKMSEEEETITNRKLQQIIKHFNVEEMEFQKNAMYHAQDPMK